MDANSVSGPWMAVIIAVPLILPAATILLYAWAYGRSSPPAEEQKDFFPSS